MSAATAIWGRRSAAVLLAMWGLLHLAGGASLLFLDGNEGLATLAPNAMALDPLTAQEATAAVIHFHGLNIAFGGLAVLSLAVWWGRRGRSWQLWTAVLIAVVLDLGLLAYLVGPGLLPPEQGLAGPVLLGLTLVVLGATRPARALHLRDVSTSTQQPG